MAKNSSSEALSGFSDPTIYLTGHNPDGKAIVHSSTKGTWSWPFGDDAGLNVVYTTSKFPVSLNNDDDIKAHKSAIESGKLGLVNAGGTVLRYVDFAPVHERVMHRTQSLDYGIVMEGEIEMELDDGSFTRLKKGDVAIQRGTMHSWRNASETGWARMLFVLQDCEPVLVGAGEKLKEDLGVGEGKM
jgi:quercetin dioxygenase-like cupin family protein